MKKKLSLLLLGLTAALMIGCGKGAEDTEKKIESPDDLYGVKKTMGWMWNPTGCPAS